MAVAVYLRVSTEEQRERQSILTQREFGERYCQLHTLTAHRVYADDGISGTIPLERRPEGSQILTDARLGKFTQLLIYKLDRLGRETRLILNAVAELEKLGVRVRSMTEEFDTGSATGRLMLTMLSGFASHERDMIRERSIAGTARMAEAGAWLGGIVPYGYRQTGEKRHARLVISEDPIPGLAISEAAVMCDIFRMATVERKSCRVIADRLNELRIPCSYIRDDRLLLRGKRKQRTSGLWRPGRVRNLIVSKTYMGVHEYGKRSASKQKLILRSVPALVTEEVWQKAQKTLQSHQLFSKRNACNQYLLRGLIKCALCGLTYVGIPGNRRGKGDFYYRCNGAHTRGIGSLGHQCPSKAVRGDHLEQQVWADVEQFLRNPVPVLQQLQTRLEGDSQDTGPLLERQTQIDCAIEQKAAERNRILGLYRRDRISDAALDQQMGEIDQEEVALRAQLDDIRGKLQGAGAVGTSVSSAKTLLARLRQRLDEPVSWGLKRQLVEVLVAGVRIETEEIGGVRQNKISVTYRFSQPGEPALLLASQSVGLTNGIRIPEEPKTVGDHIRRKRLSLKLLQKQVAGQLGVDKATIQNWEANARQPGCVYMPCIIRFLGYNPVPPAISLGERLVRCRVSLGLSQKESAKRLGVDPSTLSGWEQGGKEPSGARAAQVSEFIAEPEHENPVERRNVSCNPNAEAEIRIAS